MDLAHTPTAFQAAVAADAFNAAQSADPGLIYFGPSIEAVAAKYAALISGWDGEGWTATTIRTFADFMIAARDRADKAAWLAADLDERHKAVGEQLRGLSFVVGSDPVTGEVPVSLPDLGKPLHDVMWILIAAAVVTVGIVILARRV